MGEGFVLWQTRKPISIWTLKVGGPPPSLGPLAYITSHSPSYLHLLERNKWKGLFCCGPHLLFQPEPFISCQLPLHLRPQMGPWPIWFRGLRCLRCCCVPFLNTPALPTFNSLRSLPHTSPTTPCLIHLPFPHIVINKFWPSVWGTPISHTFLPIKNDWY